MKITFVGAGSAFSKRNGNSCAIIEAEQSHPHDATLPPLVSRLMIDCGRTVPDGLADVGLKWHDIDALYVSHAHADHTGGIEEFAFARMFVPPKSRPTIYGESNMLCSLWDRTLRGGLAPTRDPAEEFHLSDYFNPVYVGLEGEGRGFEWMGSWFQLVKLPHIMPSYGLFFQTPSNDLNPFGKSVLYTSDCTMAVNELSELYGRAQIIFQDCETSQGKSGVHAHYTDLVGLPENIKKKMWLYHYQDGDLPDARAGGFAGFVRKGQVFEL